MSQIWKGSIKRQNLGFLLSISHMKKRGIKRRNLDFPLVFLIWKKGYQKMESRFFVSISGMKKGVWFLDGNRKFKKKVACRNDMALKTLQANHLSVQEIFTLKYSRPPPKDGRLTRRFFRPYRTSLTPKIFFLKNYL